MAKSKLMEANKKIEKVVVNGYKKIEKGAVGAFDKLSYRFVDRYLAKDGEGLEEAKERLIKEQVERTEKSKKDAQDRKEFQREMMMEYKKKVETFCY